MELYGRSTARNGEHSEWGMAEPDTGLEESAARLSLWDGEVYPERPGIVDCAYYMKTGLCRYGAKCRFNHPRDRASGGLAVYVGGGEYPERVGEPECQYYLRTGTCKFGASCKFHHPRNAGGFLSNVPVNIYGYPFRPDEKECSYYLKTGQCKFGVTCKFHHPQPAGTSVPAPARQFYPMLQALSSSSSEQLGNVSAGYRVLRPPPFTGSYVPGAYGPVLVHPGVVPIPNWTPYSGTVSPALSATQTSTGGAPLYPSLPSLSSPCPSTSLQKEQQFPIRPGQPECQYFMKTGDCKFGSSCRYHHPPDWILFKSTSALSPLGLPLRPGVEPCTFYLQKGSCKFGRACKFDHPIATAGPYGGEAQPLVLQKLIGVP